MDERTVRTYLYLASLKLSIRKDEARERREAQRWAERKAQRAGKEPEFFDTGLDGRTLNGTRQELLEYWKNKATELAAGQNPNATIQNPDPATRKPPQPVPVRRESVQASQPQQQKNAEPTSAERLAILQAYRGRKS